MQKRSFSFSVKKSYNHTIFNTPAKLNSIKIYRQIQGNQAIWLK